MIYYQVKKEYNDYGICAKGARYDSLIWGQLLTTKEYKSLVNDQFIYFRDFFHSVLGSKKKEVFVKVNVNPCKIDISSGTRKADACDIQIIE